MLYDDYKNECLKDPEFAKQYEKMGQVMKAITTEHDPADYLNSPEVMAAYLIETIDNGDSEQIASAIGNVLRAQERVNGWLGIDLEKLLEALHISKHT